MGAFKSYWCIVFISTGLRSERQGAALARTWPVAWQNVHAFLHLCDLRNGIVLGNNYLDSVKTSIVGA